MNITSQGQIRSLPGALLLTALAACGGGDSSPLVVTVQTLSSRPDVISGGDALVQLQVPAGVGVADLAVTVGSTDVTSSFKTAADGSLVGVVSGLPDGASTIMVKSKVNFSTIGQLAVVNHGLQGPNFAGPKDAIYGCETTAWGLAASTDADCTAPTVVTYQYRTTGGAFKPYPTSGAAPTDVATATLLNGTTVEYIVRLETGVIDRSVYQIAILNKPGQALPTPSTSSAYPGWNQRLIYTFGGGCGGGHHQGAANGGVVTDMFLSKGYAVASSSQNTLAVQCNDVRSAEAASMVKEYFIEHFGVPLFTMGWGGSGGSMQQHLIATNYPGILNGIVLGTGVYRDTITEVNTTLDCSLIRRSIRSSALPWTDAQKQAVVGWATWSACDLSVGDPSTGGIGGLGQIMVNPTSGCNNALGTGAALGAPVVPSVFDPVTNPTGARCTYQDVLVNVFGKDPATGYARRAFDNAGVQYGLAALKAGSITGDEFVELNQTAGGYDINGKIVAARTVGDPQAVSIAYTSGRVVDGVQLASTPMIDIQGYGDFAPGFGGMHDLLQTYIVRARVTRAAGDANNQVILVAGGSSAAAMSVYALSQMDKWLSALAADKSSAAEAAKVRADKPAGLTDACWDASGTMVVQTSVDGTGSGTCSTLYPVHSDPRLVAGEPMTNDILKCTLKPLNRADYGSALTDAQFTTLQSVFPDGVCDFSKPGQGQAPISGTWKMY